MLSLREKLRALQQSPSEPVEAHTPPPQDCLIRKTVFELPVFSGFSDGILATMQNDDRLPAKIAPEDFLFLDTETTGLSGGAGTVAFLTGVGEIREGRLIVSQYLMRDYDEELFMLQHVQRHLQQCRALVTFNGRSFDVPLLSSRFIMKRLPAALDGLPHIDLLHSARRVWKLRLKRCSLAALEEKIYDAPRQNDLPGAEVPQRYFSFLKTRDFSLLEDILRHNAQDIVTLARLLFTLSALHENPLSAAYAEDIYSLGRVYERRRADEMARKCYRAADRGAISALSRQRLGDNLRRGRDFHAAASVYEKMIASGQGGGAPYIALSKLLEHRLRQPEAAAEIVRRGLLYLSDIPLNPRTEAELDDLQRRYLRLLDKTRRGDMISP